MSGTANGTELTKDEIREIRRMAKNSATDSGPGLIFLPVDIDALKHKDGAAVEAIITAAVLRFCGLEQGGGNFTPANLATLRHVAAAQEAYAAAWISERRRRRLPIVPYYPNTAPKVTFSRAKHGKGDK